MLKKIYPAKLKGCIDVPPSKSQAHRLLLATVPAKETCVIDHVAFSDDITATLDAIKTLGKDVEITKGLLGNRLIVKDGDLPLKTPKIDCKESGSTLRFTIPLALAITGEAVFTGQGRLGARPLTPYKEMFEEKGIKWGAGSEGLPLRVKGRLGPGCYRLPGDVSSQFITGLLMALPLLEGDSVLEIDGVLESAPYVDITTDVLEKFGVSVVQEERSKKYRIPGNQTFRSVDVSVEGDWSQGAFHIMGGILGEEITVKGLDLLSPQGDKRIVELLRCMGADIRVEDKDLVVAHSDLQCIDADISDCPDLAPVLALACALAKGKSRITGAKRLRMKESDRIQSIGNTLIKLGAKVNMTPDGFEIEGVSRLQGGTVSSYGDHRIAMMVAMAAVACDRPILLHVSDAVRKSYPNFWEDYRKLGGMFNEQSMG